MFIHLNISIILFHLTNLLTKSITMKKVNYFLTAIVIFVLVIPITFVSCDKEEDEVETSISIDKTTTDQLNVGETVTATVTIISAGVKTFKYYKVVDEVKGSAVDVTSQLTQSGDAYTYSFSYTIGENDDLHTLGFEFEITDNNNVVKTTALVVSMNLSTRSLFVKYDWKITGEDHTVWGDLLQPWDAAKTFRFYEDGTYQVDLTAEYPDSLHHFCNWVYKETPSNGDTLAIVRLIRKQLSGDIGLDEYYDFRITTANESEMTMYWDLAVWAIFDIQRTFTSQQKGEFQPYGTAGLQTYIEGIAVLDCSTIDEDLFDF